MAMTEYVGDRFQRMALLHHSGGEAVAKRVRAFDRTVNSRGPNATVHYG